MIKFLQNVVLKEDLWGLSVNGVTFNLNDLTMS